METKDTLFIICDHEDEAELFLHCAGQEAAYTVSLPAGGSHQLLQVRAAVLMQQLQACCGLARPADMGLRDFASDHCLG